MFGRIWGYLKALIGGGVEARMDPSVQIDQMLAEARKQDLELRNQAARVVAHRTELQMKLDRAVEDAAGAKDRAAQSLRNADAAARSGDAAGVEKWTNTAQAMALQLQSSESMVESLKAQYGQATEQADLAKSEVSRNELRLKELTAKRMELLGKLEQAKMQEQVNKTLEQISRPVADNGPSVQEIEDKINARMARASAHAELESTSISGGQRELDQSMAELEAQRRLDQLRAELGIAPAEAPAQVEAATPAPAAEPAPAPADGATPPQQP